MLLTSSACLASDLPQIEMRWLNGAWTVAVSAKESGIPLDITVQSQPMPGAAPLALGFVDGRCKLVLSMRGNAEAQSTLDRIVLLDQGHSVETGSHAELVAQGSLYARLAARLFDLR
jgi:hypothetical protein